MRYYLNKYTNLGYVFKFNEAYLSNNYLYYGKYNNINYLMCLCGAEFALEIVFIY